LYTASPADWAKLKELAAQTATASTTIERIVFVIPNSSIILAYAERTRSFLLLNTHNPREPR
jgi:hypothetical protein